MTTLIKHCGITSVEDAQLAVEAGAWALGINFWQGSPRRCEPDVAQLIGLQLHRAVLLCGVFVNAPIDEIELAVRTAGLSLVQLHGEEDPGFCAEVSRRTGAKVIKATRVRSRASLRAAAAYDTDFHLLDAYVEGVPGGTGKTIDPQLLRDARLPAPVILGGGLTPDNVADAIAAAKPFAVDVASGTETAAGVKDPIALRAFGEAVREASPSVPS